MDTTCDAVECFICCGNLDEENAITYFGTHGLQYTKMSVMNCLKKILKSYLQDYIDAEVKICFCPTCNNVITDLDCLLYQYTDLQDRLRTTYRYAHGLDTLQDVSVNAFEDWNVTDDDTNSERKFLETITEQSVSSKRSIKQNRRYAQDTQVEQPNALRIHIGNTKPKRGRGRPRKQLLDETTFVLPLQVVSDGGEMGRFHHDDGSIQEKQAHENHSPLDSTTISQISVNSCDSENTRRVEMLKCERTSVIDNAMDSYSGVKHSDNPLSNNEDLGTAKKPRKLPANSKCKKRSKGKYMRREKCLQCGKVVVGRMGLRRHMQLHSTANEQKVCEVCGRLLHNMTAYKVHMQQLHKTHQDPMNSTSVQSDQHERVICQICGKTYRGASGLSYHLAAKHNKGPRYPCSKCSRVFPHSRNLSSHMAQAHGSYSVMCEYCGEAFKLQTHLNSHINSVHRGVTSWVCGFCPAKFSSHVDYRIHVNKHKGLTFQCDMCDKQYSWREALKKHKRMKHVLPHTCSGGDCDHCQSVLTITAPKQDCQPPRDFSVNLTESKKEEVLLEFGTGCQIMNPSSNDTRDVMNTVNSVSDLNGSGSELSSQLSLVKSVRQKSAKKQNNVSVHRVISQTELLNEMKDSTVLSPEMALANTQSDQDNLSMDSVIAPIILDAKLKENESRMEADVTPSRSVISDVGFEITRDNVIIDNVMTTADEKTMAINSILPSVDPDMGREETSTCSVSNVISEANHKGVDSEKSVGTNLSLVTAETSDSLFAHAEAQGIASQQVKEVVIVETDASVNYDYIVYHVSGSPS